MKSFVLETWDAVDSMRRGIGVAGWLGGAVYLGGVVLSAALAPAVILGLLALPIFGAAFFLSPIVALSLQGSAPSATRRWVGGVLGACGALVSSGASVAASSGAAERILEFQRMQNRLGLGDAASTGVPGYFELLAAMPAWVWVGVFFAGLGAWVVRAEGRAAGLQALFWALPAPGAVLALKLLNQWGVIALTA